MENIEKTQEYHKNGYRIILMSGRSESTRDDTEEWMRSYNVPYYTIIMRREGDHRPDDIIKEEFFHAYFKPELVEKVYDDRPSIIRMWKRIGVDVVDVGMGIDF